ncbi:MAG: FkbM family methyltransferase [Azospirillaceae bacterium]|nr:FkbM family methyltransferase [Azospirillaceae bacterium]
MGRQKQDQWVAEEALPGRRDGFFLDLAATDGIAYNNTWVLEREFGWTGIAVEPNLAYFNALKQNRLCVCVPDCIDEGEGTVDFLINGELGGIVGEDTDNKNDVRPEFVERVREKGLLQTLKTRSLLDVLEHHNAPSVIDYFSFDVEGAETRILRSFPFEKYTFLSLTIERPSPEINEALFRHGYLFVRNVASDSFYVHESAPTATTIAREPFAQQPPKRP